MTQGRSVDIALHTANADPWSFRASAPRLARAMQSAQTLRSRDASIATAVLAASIALGLELSPTARAQTPYLVDDIVPAPGASSFPAEFTACQGLAFFRAY